MISSTTHLSPPDRWTVEWVEETGSTQDELLRRCDDGSLIDSTAFAALYQRHGRGRLDRRWEAPPGSNLLVSLGFTQEVSEQASDPGIVMRAAALAVVAAAGRYGVKASLKWPNDVLVGDSKLAGLLAQRHETGAVVVGVGLNVNWAPPGGARLATGSPESSELALGEVLGELLVAFDSYRADDDAVLDRNSIESAYRSALATLGRRVRVELFDSEVVGTAIDITDTGCLVIDVGGHREVVSAGDVYHLRPV